ncbi:hypothetical protein Bhyg_00457 [Pseudolycoriella hygida]|uniref:Uncharacterized protein n=1 Tax=Pseudolycoriella hygida TaxID=35572 RepID=A0A9Q0N839_9DIPT|nr:hypothetical protein Bhyg_00457 [Pseudolycoriella hygida]
MSKYLVKPKKCRKHQNWITHYWIFSIFFVDIFTQYGTAANILPDENDFSILKLNFCDLG